MELKVHGFFSGNYCDLVRCFCFFLETNRGLGCSFGGALSYAIWIHLEDCYIFFVSMEHVVILLVV